MTCVALGDDAIIYYRPTMEDPDAFIQSLGVCFPRRVCCVHEAGEIAK